MMLIYSACAALMTTPVTAIETPPANKLGNSPPTSTIAVAPFTTEVENGWGDLLAHAASTWAQRCSDVQAFSVRQTRSSLRDLGLQAAGLIETAAAKRFGAQLGATHVVSGHLSQTNSGLQLELKVRDLSSAEEPTPVVVSAKLGAPVALEQALITELKRALNGRCSANDTALPGSPSAEPVLTSSDVAWQALAAALVPTLRQSLSPQAADVGTPMVLTEDEISLMDSKAAEALAADATLGDALAIRALAKAARGDMEAASLLAKQAVACNTGRCDPMTRLTHAFITMRLDHWDEATTILGETVIDFPGCLHGRGTLGQLYVRQKRWREAQAVFQAYSTAVPRQPWVLAQLGYVAARQRRYDEAIAFTKQATELAPNSSNMWLELASRYIDANRHQDAAAALNRAAAAPSIDPRVFVRQGYLALLRGDDDGAIKASQRALEVLRPDSQRSEVAYAHLNLARSYGHAGKLDDAFSHLEKALATGLTSLKEIETDPKLDRLRGDARYAKLPH